MRIEELDCKRVITVLFMAAAISITNLACNAQENRFECLGIGGGGQMYSIGISPHDKNLMHLACDMGTFYMSEDGGRKWRMIDELQMSGHAFSPKTAYHPRDPNVVYQIHQGGYAGQSFRISKDRGKTWEILCNDFPSQKDTARKKKERRFRVDGTPAITIDPEDPDLIFVTTMTGLFRSSNSGKAFARCEDITVGWGVIWPYIMPAVGEAKRLSFVGTTEGLYVSEDLGKTWVKKGTGLPEGMNGMCATTDKDGVVHIYACYKGGVYFSHDSGSTFEKAAGLPDHLFSLITMPKKPHNTVYVSNWVGDFGVWKTTDGGKSWERVFGPYGEVGKRLRRGWIGTEINKGWGGRANSIAVAPTDPKMVAYTNTGELFITRDGGKSWQEHTSNYYGPDQNKIEKGRPWSSTGLEVAMCTNLTFDPFVKDRWYLNYGDICFLVSEDGGKSWRRSVKGIPRGWTNSMYEIAVDPDNKGVIYGGCSRSHNIIQARRSEGGVVMSTDHGDTWKTICNGLKKSTSATDIQIDFNSPKDKRTLYCVTDGVYKSTDGGQSWTKKMKGLGRPGNDIVIKVKLLPDGTLYALVTARPDVNNKWRFPHEGGGIWKSTDGAESWQDITKGMDLAYPVVFTIDPFDQDHIYLATTQGSGREPAGLWETKNGGKKWNLVLDGGKLNKLAGRKLYPFLHSNSLTFHPTRKGWVYYTSLTHGVWLTKDGGKTWKRFVGIPRQWIARVVFDPRDPDTVFMCGLGLWKGPAAGF